MKTLLTTLVLATFYSFSAFSAEIINSQQNDNSYFFTVHSRYLEISKNAEDPKQVPLSKERFNYNIARKIRYKAIYKSKKNKTRAVLGYDTLDSSKRIVEIKLKNREENLVFKDCY